MHCIFVLIKAFKSVSCVLVMTNKRVICLYSISLTSFPLLFVQLGLLPCGHTPLRSSSVGIMRWTMESHGRSPSATNRQTNYPRRKIREAGRSSPTALMESMFNLIKSHLPYTVCNNNSRNYAGKKKASIIFQVVGINWKIVLCFFRLHLIHVHGSRWVTCRGYCVTGSSSGQY